jgi:tetratricopeptide (TPR) repeat protein
MSPRPVEIPDSEFDAALALAREGRFADAAERVRRTLAHGEQHPARTAPATNTLARIARMAEAAGEIAAAERIVTLALEASPRWADLHVQHAALQVACGDRVAACASLDRAIQLNPRYVAARLERAMLDVRAGLVGEAIDAVESLASDSHVEDPRALAAGFDALRRADADLASAQLRRAFRLHDPGLEPYLERAQALCEEGRPAQAASLLRDAAVRFDGYPDLHLALGEAELRAGALDDAVATLARALALNPDLHAARIQLARALEGLGETGEALDQVGLVLEADPEHPEAVELHNRWAFRGRRARAGDEPLRKAA